MPENVGRLHILSPPSITTGGPNMKNYGPVAAALTALLWFASIATHAAEDQPAESAEQDKDKDKKEKPVPEPKVWTSRHQIRLGGKAIDYEATTGTLLMKNDKDEPIALYGFTSYVRQGQDVRTRPLMFAYNGGPGSASAWLHMGILGPRRTVIEDLENNTRGPFRLVDHRTVRRVEQLDAPGELLVAQEQRVRRGVGQAAGHPGFDHV